MTAPTRRLFLTGFGAAAAAALAGCATPPKNDALAVSSHTPPTPQLPQSPQIETSLDVDQLSEQFPWINDARKSVGWMVSGRQVGNKIYNLLGSAVLLDERGTLAFCWHQTFDTDAPKVFPSTLMRFTLAKKQYSDPVIVDFLAPIPGQDCAFGRMDPRDIKKYGLVPVRWAEKTPYGEKAIGLGFPGNTGELRAEYGEGIYPDPTTYRALIKGKVIDVDIGCNANIFGHGEEGESGGAMFDLSGNLIGIVKSGNSYIPTPLSKPLMQTIFTPVETLWSDYSSLFPSEAKNALLAGERPQTPTDPYCVFQPQDLSALNR